MSLFHLFLCAFVSALAGVMLFLMLRSAGVSIVDGTKSRRSRSLGSWTIATGRPLVFLTGPTAIHEVDRRRAVERISNLDKAVLSHTENHSIPATVRNRRDLTAILNAEAVAVLPLWNYHPLPRLHVALANALGIPVVRADDLSPVPIEQRQLGTTTIDGVCDCDPDAVIKRVGELFGHEQKRQLIARN